MTNHSVFVVEDDEPVRDSLLTLLRVQGIRARGFCSGKDFFDIGLQGQVDGQGQGR